MSETENIEINAVVMQTLAKTLTDSIKSLGHECFVGGSIRFGYSNANSDIDLFVKNDRSHTIVKTLVNQLGIREVNAGNVMSDYKDEGVQSIWTYKDIAHICFCDEHKYAQLEQDHVQMDLLFGAHPILLKVVGALKKRTRLSGGNIFRILREVSRDS